jgi:hypothetical protein
MSWLFLGHVNSHNNNDFQYIYIYQKNLKKLILLKDDVVLPSWFTLEDPGLEIIVAATG